MSWKAAKSRWNSQEVDPADHPKEAESPGSPILPFQLSLFAEETTLNPVALIVMETASLPGLLILNLQFMLK